MEKHVPVHQIIHVPVERAVEVERLVTREKAVEVEKVVRKIDNEESMRNDDQVLLGCHYACPSCCSRGKGNAHLVSGARLSPHY